jgi:eukaryotic-like serine/threonine-protein kinase
MPADDKLLTVGADTSRFSRAMGDARWARVVDLFNAALDHPTHARGVFLRESCGGDDALHGEVASLLTARERAGDFLSNPVVSASVPPVLDGQRVGPYRIVGEIGRGGMGRVYRAVRDDDTFQKTVAFKLVDGSAGPEMHRRFATERHILARLEHANIATILDGGTTQEGQPYLIMEYVEGEAIDAYCARHALGKRDRLSLFLTICGAVHYAHQNLVIHCDLKPQNILVGPDHRPKLLDFGIARLITSSIAGEAAPTTSLFPAMTLAYASPEQVRGRAITIASDIYALGIILHELMTGRRPYEARGDSLDAAIEAICKTEPPLPSAVACGVAKTTRPPVMPGELAGDVDAIVRKALRKEPEHRYQSVLELADDVRRHLDGRAVVARGDRLGYYATTFVRRHRLAIAAAALVLASLLGGLATTAWQWRRAEANRLRAEQRVAEVRDVATSFLFDFHDAIANLPGGTAARELVVERATRYLDSLAGEARLDIGVQRQLAAAHERLADIQGGAGRANLGKTTAALASYDKALALRRALAVFPGDEADVLALARLEMLISRMLTVTADWAGSAAAARRALVRIESLAGKTPSDLRSELAAVHVQLAYTAARSGNEDAAMADQRRAVALFQAYSQAHPDHELSRARLANAEIDLVERLVRHGEVREAMALTRTASARLDALVAAAPNNANYRRELLRTLNIGSSALEAGGDHADALSGLRRSVEIARGLVDTEPANQTDRIALTYSLEYLGAALVRIGDAGEGIARLIEASEQTRQCADADPASAFLRDRIAQIRADLGFALDRMHERPAEKCAALRECVTLWTELEGKGQLSGEVRQDFDKARRLLTACTSDGARSD